MKVTKTTTDLYSVRRETKADPGAWGDISLAFGEHSVNVMINSDYGSFGYYWGATGPDPRKFLCEIDMHYAMNKLTSCNLYEPDPDKYSDEVKESIIGARKEQYLDKDQAREAWDDMLSIVEDSASVDLMYHQLVDHELFEAVFGDHEGLPCATRVRPTVVAFWDNVWKPFVKQLQSELS